MLISSSLTVRLLLSLPFNFIKHGKRVRAVNIKKMRSNVVVSYSYRYIYLYQKPQNSIYTLHEYCI